MKYRPNNDGITNSNGGSSEISGGCGVTSDCGKDYCPHNGPGKGKS